MASEQNYKWQWQLPATPAQLWPLVSDTNRFNLDAKVPPLEDPRGSNRLRNAKRELSLRLFGIPVRWMERPFEWLKPYRFRVLREYTGGLFEYLDVLVHLEEKDGGTLLTYEVKIKPRNPVGILAAKIQLGIISKKSFAAAFKEYAELVGGTLPPLGKEGPRFATRGRDRMENLLKSLGEDNNPEAIKYLRTLLEEGDDMAVHRLRPVSLAHLWGLPEDEVIALFLRATRAGLLDFRWELLCPNCRGAKSTAKHLNSLADEVHCETCNIDYGVTFDQSVELTFRPNPAIRRLSVHEFCVGGPQLTPHILVQQLMDPGEERTFPLSFTPGTLRFRALEEDRSRLIEITAQGEKKATLTIADSGAVGDTLHLHPDCTLTFRNETGEEQLLILERTAWDKHALTAARIISSQLFRDLFSSEALKPGQEFDVGSLTLAFTDLKGSTAMYQDIGDAAAFGLVMDHFEVLKQEVAKAGGAQVKTVGDAVMASFLDPGPAVMAFLRAQKTLKREDSGGRGLTLRAGLHQGPAIAVTLNERLDYFGSVVNKAARLEGQSSGDDVVVSGEVYKDPSVQALLKENKITAESFTAHLKGFEGDEAELWRLRLP